MASDESSKDDGSSKRYAVEVVIEAGGPGEAGNKVADRLTSMDGISTIGTVMRTRDADGSKNRPGAAEDTEQEGL